MPVEMWWLDAVAIMGGPEPFGGHRQAWSIWAPWQTTMLTLKLTTLMTQVTWWSGEVALQYGLSGTLEVGQAVRWTKDTGMVGLGTLPGDTASVATSVNCRGDVMVGVSISSDGERRGFRWTQATGMQTIEQWLKDNGVDVKGLPRVVTATAVNGAGNVVFGSLAD